MTAQAETGALAPVEQRVTVTIDGFEITVPKGMLVIRAAELLGIQIPRFCDHPLLDPVGACRQCLVEVEGQAKPLASCTTTCTDGMKVRTQLTSRVADKAQSGVMLPETGNACLMVTDLRRPMPWWQRGRTGSRPA